MFKRLAFFVGGLFLAISSCQGGDVAFRWTRDTWSMNGIQHVYAANEFNQVQAVISKTHDALSKMMSDVASAMQNTPEWEWTLGMGVDSGGYTLDRDFLPLSVHTARGVLESFEKEKPDLSRYVVVGSAQDRGQLFSTYDNTLPFHWMCRIESFNRYVDENLLPLPAPDQEDAEKKANIIKAKRASIKKTYAQFNAFFENDVKKPLEKILAKRKNPQQYLDLISRLAVKTFALTSHKRRFGYEQKYATSIMQRYFNVIKSLRQSGYANGDLFTKHQNQLDQLFRLSNEYAALTFNFNYSLEFGDWHNGTEQDRTQMVVDASEEIAKHTESLNTVIERIKASKLIPDDAPVYTQFKQLQERLDCANRKLQRRKDELAKQSNPYQEMLNNNLTKPAQLEAAYEAAEIFDAPNGDLSSKQAELVKYIEKLEERHKNPLYRHERIAVLRSPIVLPFMKKLLAHEPSIALFQEKMQAIKDLMEKGEVGLARHKLAAFMALLRDHPVGLLIEGHLGQDFVSLQDEVKRRYHEQHDLRVIRWVLAGSASVAAGGGLITYVAHKFNDVPPEKVDALPARVRPFVRFARWMGWAKYCSAK